MALQIRSDAGNTGANGVIEVELIGRYGGAPVLVLDPPSSTSATLHYCWPRRRYTHRERQIMNQGTGNASPFIQEIYLPRVQTSVFQMSSPAFVHQIRRCFHLQQADPETWIGVPITLEPTNNLDHSNDLFVVARPSEDEDPIEVSVALTGSSKDRRRIQVTPDELIFETAAGDPLPLGRTEYRSVTVSNIGLIDLRIT